MATFAVGVFRTQFPEFADKVAYPDTMIDLWAGLAQLQVLPAVWKDTWLMGVSLYTAHELVLARQNEQAGKIGGAPGTAGGNVNSKSVGNVSVGYDTQSTSEKDAGWWNLTNYGKQFYRLVKIFGAGAIQL